MLVLFFEYGFVVGQLVRNTLRQQLPIGLIETKYAFENARLMFARIACWIKRVLFEFIRFYNCLLIIR